MRRIDVVPAPGLHGADSGEEFPVFIHRVWMRVTPVFLRLVPIRCRWSIMFLHFFRVLYRQLFLRHSFPVLVAGDFLVRRGCRGIDRVFDV